MIPTSSSGAAQAVTISALLEIDHDELDAVFEEARHLTAAAELEAALTRFSQASEGLARHIEAEEDLLFPAFEEVTGMRGGPTHVMRTEHVAIRRVLVEVDAALGARNVEAALRAFDDLTALLAPHNHKEEQVLYPMIDRAMGGGARLASLVESVRQAITPPS